MLLLPVFSTQLRCFTLHNSNALSSFNIPKSFPIPMEGRDDFFCVDPTSLSMEQLNAYKREMLQLIKIETSNLQRMEKNSNARINAYNQGISLAEEMINSSSTNPKARLPTTFLPNNNGPIGCVDPRALTNTQLQLYIHGINEEITYENKLTDESKKESTTRIEAYQIGIDHATNELNIRKSK